MASVEEDRIGAAVINLWLLIANASKVERATNDAMLSISDGIFALGGKNNSTTEL